MFLISSYRCHRGKQRKSLPSEPSDKHNDQFKIYQRNPSRQCPVVPQTCWDPGPKLRTTADPTSQRQRGTERWVPIFSAVSPKNCMSKVCLLYLALTWSDRNVPQNISPLALTLELGRTFFGSWKPFSFKKSQGKIKGIIDSYPLRLSYKLAEFTTRQRCEPQLRNLTTERKPYNKRGVAWVRVQPPPWGFHVNTEPQLSN